LPNNIFRNTNYEFGKTYSKSVLSRFGIPFVENEEEVFLKTIIPSRQLTKKYLGGKRYD
jgi:hypothetical protein